MFALLTAIALASTSAPSPCGQDTRVRVWLAVDSDWRAAKPTIRAVVDDIWASAGLPIDWVDDGSRVDLLIAVMPQLQTKPGVLGKTIFRGDQPMPVALVSIEAVREWVDRYRTRLFNVLITAARVGDSALVARVLGYAAAHEMGHFVLATRSHASSGVMRATLRDSDVKAQPSSWVLDATNRERLRRRLNSSPWSGGCNEARLTQ